MSSHDFSRMVTPIYTLTAQRGNISRLGFGQRTVLHPSVLL
jgi:hypothetical protein